ncbi:MAG TPA: Rnase Y domain-containing protein, partial [Thermoanaerobaculia bacterium]|nr:Rnase Y domain-containing protein [Thermoanaerobaculia bacterium]
MLTVIAVLVGLVAGGAAAAAWLTLRSGSRVRAAAREADAIRREAQIEAREQSVKLRSEIETEVQDRRRQIVKIEERILQQEEEIGGKLTEVAHREQGLLDREAHVRQLQEDLKAAKDGAV